MTRAPITPTEAFVMSVCKTSFLSLWCYANPLGKMKKELCDILVVCDPAVIIVSVKEILLNENKDPEVAYTRWKRKAVEESVKQVYGAEGWLNSATNVIRSDGLPGLKLPPMDRRRVSRIAVAFGDRGQAVIKSGDYGDGFVHVMTEQSFKDVLAELNTITEFTEYLGAKEALAGSNTLVVCEGSEANMLGWYLAHSRTFPSGQNVAIFDETIWLGLQNDPAFLRRKEADQISYVWDRLIEGLSDPDAKPLNGPGPELNDLELGLRVMARETRLDRRGLGEYVLEFLKAAKSEKTRARIHAGRTGVIYVIVYFSPEEDPERRKAELTARCFVARLIVGSGEVMVGIGLSNHVPGKGSASDLVYMNLPEWRAEDETTALRLQKDGRFFVGAVIQRKRVDEYPTESSTK